MPQTPDVSVVIVNWKVKDLVARCVASLLEHTRHLPLEIFVVDNDSGDGSVEALRAVFPEIHVIANAQNLGFGKAQNIGIRRSQGKYVCILNPDTEFSEDSMQKMYDWMENPSHQKIGFLGPRLTYPDGRLQPSLKGFPDTFSQVLVLLQLHHFFPHASSVRRFLAKDVDYPRQQPVEQIMGAVMFARGDILRHQLHGFDEDFWIWFEDVDICKRMLALGYENWYAPVTSVIHHEGKSFGQVLAPHKQRFFNTSLRIYARKHLGLPAYIIFTVLHPVSMLLSYLVALFHIQPRPQSRV